MSIFDPELRENKETNFEKNKFSLDTEKKLSEALDQQKERFPDIIQCPNESCGTPLKVAVHKEYIDIHCNNCGWQRTINKSKIGKL